MTNSDSIRRLRLTLERAAKATVTKTAFVPVLTLRRAINMLEQYERNERNHEEPRP